MNALLVVLLLQRAGVGAWDTGQASAEPLALEAKGGWTALSEPVSSFKGDAVISNGRLTLVVRKQSPAAELYAGAMLRSRLTLNAGGALERVALVEQSKAGVCLEA